MRRAIPAGRLDDLLGSRRGLVSAEARARLVRWGPNDIIEVPGRPVHDLAIETARDPMIWFLLGTGALYGALGEIAEALTLVASIAPVAGMDLFLHRRTRASTEGLRHQLASRASVLRDGGPVAVPVADVVPGDLAIVSAGEPFPADGVIEEGAELQAEESALTGEAHPIRKRPLPAGAGAAPRALDTEHWGFAGTRLLTGQARLRVVATGKETLYGEIVQSAVLGSRTRTPLQIAVSHLVAVLVAAATVLCAILAVVRLQQGHGWLDALLSAITLAVAALPEEFPVVFTLFLGVGVFRLARRRTLVRRAVCVENMGRISCICADKTGTITLGELQLTHLLPARDSSEEQLLAIASMASRPESGDPLDAAIARENEKRGRAAPAAADRIATFPFTEDRRRETALVRQPDGGCLAATKGSPEVVLAMCALDEEARAGWMRQVDALAEDGHKVIACASRAIRAQDWPGGEPDRGFVFAGLLACEDPVRESVAEAVSECRAAGIHTLMVTGDYPATARAVALAIGLGAGAPRIVTGEELEVLLRDEPRPSLAAVDVVARAIPAHKLALVRALQAEGETVAVTGDGVNDVPALQAADIGIAMGERGTRSAREVAGVVLLDDNFRTIVRAIDEGRQLFRNLCLSFEYLLLIHIPLVVSAALVPLAGYPLLYLPVHIVWLELIIHPSALLAFQELPPPRRLQARARGATSRFFSPFDWFRIAAFGALLTALVVLCYARSLGVGREAEHARAMALAVLTLSSAGTTAVLSGLRTRASRWIVLATVLSSVAIVQTASLAERLHLRPLHRDDWVIAAGVALAAMVLLLGTRAWALRAHPGRNRGARDGRRPKGEGRG